MGAPDILMQLRQMGLTLTAYDDAIRVEPKSAITDEARAIIREHKAELLALLCECSSAPFERREGYEYPRFTIPTNQGRYEFLMEIPKGKYDPFAVLELFEKYHGGTVH